MMPRCSQGSRFSLLLLFVLSLLMGNRAARTQTAPKFTVIHNFTGTDGAYSYTTLSLGLDGSYYGTTYGGGAGNANAGTIFKITPSGALTTLHSFTGGADGYGPYGKLTLGLDGNFYGMAQQGGENGVGTVFKITPTGTLTTLHSFNTSDGAYTADSLTLGFDGNFYGMTEEGGAYGYGTVFKITPTGTLTTLHSFDDTDGANPGSKLALGPDGNFYGTTSGLGTTGYGTVFKITCSGTFTVLHTFNGSSDGSYSNAGLTLGPDGSFYGLTAGGGTNYSGTVFKITCSGTFTVLHNFIDATDGSTPEYESLLLGPDGNFYGMTLEGGPSNWGTVFRLTPSGTFTTLHSFKYPTDGVFPFGGLTLGLDGKLYGVTYTGGENSFGTVFNLQVKWF